MNYVFYCLVHLKILYLLNLLLKTIINYGNCSIRDLPNSVKHGDLLDTKKFLPVDQFLDSMSTIISEWEGVQKKMYKIH